MPELSWLEKKRIKAYKNKKHDDNYQFPMCHLCEDCESDHEIKGYVCKLLDNKNVTQSHFGRNSPRNCPKR